MIKVVKDAEIISGAVPSTYVNNTIELLNSYITECQVIVSAKGIENDNLLTKSEVIRHELKSCNIIVTLYAPTYTEEVSFDSPTYIVLHHKIRYMKKLFKKILLQII